MDGYKCEEDGACKQKLCLSPSTPPPLFSHNYKQYIMHLKLFGPLYSLVSQGDFIVFTQSNRYMWIGINANRPPPLSSLLGFLFKTIFDICMCQAHGSWMKSPKCMYWEKKLSPRVVKPEMGRGMGYPQVYKFMYKCTIRQKKF